MPKFKQYSFVSEIDLVNPFGAVTYGVTEVEKSWLNQKTKSPRGICHIYYDQDGQKQIEVYDGLTEKGRKKKFMLLGKDDKEEILKKINRVDSKSQVIHKPEYGPVCGVKLKGNAPEKYKWTDMYGTPLHTFRTKTIQDFYKATKSDKYGKFIKNKSGENVELVESWLHGTIKPYFQFIGEAYRGKIDYDLSLLRTWVIDIEVDSEGGFADTDKGDKMITSLTVWDKKSDRFYVWALKPWDKYKSALKDTNIDLDRIEFTHVKPYKYPKDIREEIEKRIKAGKLRRDELEQIDDMNIIQKFSKKMKEIKPDIMVGFYSKNFDFPYIINRAQFIGYEVRSVRETVNPNTNYNPNKLRYDICTDEIFKFSKYTYNGKPRVKEGKTERYPFIGGVQLLDYQMMYKKFVFTPREMYSLDYIASQELGETKLDYSDHDNLAALWREDPQLYIDYNIYDVQLIRELDEKLGLIDLTCTIAYFAKCNFNDVMGTVAPWDSIMFNELLDRKMLIPPEVRMEKSTYPGAYVLPNPIGVQDWLFSLDLASLYPHVQQQYNISPETLLTDPDDLYDIPVDQNAIDDRFFNKEVEFDRSKILSASGHYFKKDQEGIIPQVLKGIYANRKVAKNEMLKLMDDREVWKKENGIDVKTEFVDQPEGRLKDQWAELNKPISALNNYQMAMKILMNSEYGALANRWFRYYDVRLARAVTLGGQLALKWAKEKLEQHPYAKKYKYRVVYGDTDSLYVSCEWLVEQLRLRNPEITDQELADQIVKFIKKKIQPIIDEGYEDLAEYMNANENRMFMETEKVITNALFSTKKRYAMNVLWDEGVTYPEPKLKVKGFEIVRSSTPKVIRDALKKAISILLIDEEKLREYVKEQKKKFKTFEAEKIAFPRSANNIKKYRKEDAKGNLIWDYKRKIFNPEKKTTSGTPIGVKAAIVYNRYITKKKLPYPLVQSGEKIKFIYLRSPNSIDEKVIGFIRRMPDDLKKFIDWNLMFDKSFLAPIHRIYENMGTVFTLEKETNILDLF